jgi:hypothetical protein
MKVVAHLPAQHTTGCPAWDHWPCNCGARPIPLVRLDEAEAACDDVANRAIAVFAETAGQA